MGKKEDKVACWLRTMNTERFYKIISVFIFVIPRLDRGIQRKALDYPDKPDNDN